MHVGNRYTGPARLAMLAIALILGGASFGARSAYADDGCLTHAANAERELGIPNGLLQSLAMVESGEDDNPYAISSHGRSIVARDAKAAAKLIRDHRGNLRNDTYVGCMQLSLQAHRTAFQPVEKIVEPKQNVWYAGRMLARLHNEEGNWRFALVRYSGNSADSGNGYVCRVWRRLNGIDEQSAALIENANCPGETASVAPRSRQQARNHQVAAIN